MAITFPNDSHMAQASTQASRMQHVSQFKQENLISELADATAVNEQMLQQEVQVFRAGVMARSMPMCEPTSLAARKRCLTGDVHAAANSFGRKFVEAPPGADMENAPANCECNEYPHHASCSLSEREAFALEVMSAAEGAQDGVHGAEVDVLDSWLAMNTQFDPRRDGTVCAWNCGQKDKAAGFSAEASALEAIFQGAA
jgi:hypothetical protein